MSDEIDSKNREIGKLHIGLSLGRTPIQLSSEFLTIHEGFTVEVPNEWLLGGVTLPETLVIEGKLDLEGARVPETLFVQGKLDLPVEPTPLPEALFGQAEAALSKSFTAQTVNKRLLDRIADFKKSLESVVVDTFRR